MTAAETASSFVGRDLNMWEMNVRAAAREFVWHYYIVPGTLVVLQIPWFIFYSVISYNPHSLTTSDAGHFDRKLSTFYPAAMHLSQYRSYRGQNGSKLGTGSSMTRGYQQVSIIRDPQAKTVVKRCPKTSQFAIQNKSMKCDSDR